MPRVLTRTARRLGAIALAALLLAAMVPVVLAPAGPASTVRDPAHNAPAPNTACSASASATGVWRVKGPCRMEGNRLVYEPAALNRLYLRAIDSARRGEGLGLLRLPLTFSRMDAVEQLAVLTNLERVARGLPALVGTTRTLSFAARQGAEAARDPVLASSDRSWGSVWAGGSDVTVLEAWFGWMYADGWGGPGATFNESCGSPGAPGCWGHRNNLLGDWGVRPAAGISAWRQGGVDSYTMILESGAGLSLSPLLPAGESAIASSSVASLLFS